MTGPTSHGADIDARDGVLTDVRQPAVRRVRDVLRASHATRRTILIDDEENILQALVGRVRIDSVYCTAGREETGRRLASTAGRDIPLHILTGKVAEAAFGRARSSRVFALARQPRVPQLRVLTQRTGDIVVLDGVRLTGNIGAITRSALAFGAAGLVLVDCGVTSIFDRRLIRASRGGVFRVPLIPASGEELIAFLRARRVPLVSLDPRAPHLVDATTNLQGRVALLLGGEKRGASPLVHRHVTQQVRIPTTTDVESLNVSVAAAIGLYERRAATVAASDLEADWGSEGRPRPPR